MALRPLHGHDTGLDADRWFISDKIIGGSFVCGDIIRPVVEEIMATSTIIISSMGTFRTAAKITRLSMDGIDKPRSHL